MRAFSVEPAAAGRCAHADSFSFRAKEEGDAVQSDGVSSRKTGNGTVVTVSADAPLNRTQTWQDEEGFHMSLPGASPGSMKGTAARGDGAQSGQVS